MPSSRIGSSRSRAMEVSPSAIGRGAQAADDAVREARDFAQVLGPPEAAEPFADLDDAPGQRRADAGDGGELFGARAVQVDAVQDEVADGEPALEAAPLDAELGAIAAVAGGELAARELGVDGTALTVEDEVAPHLDGKQRALLDE